MLNYLTVILFIIIGITQYQADGTKFKVTSKIYMDISQNDEPIGRVIFGLFGDDAPKTVKNFEEICINGIEGKTYKGTVFHRVIKKFVVQGGDILSGNGTGSVSIYGKYFEDENLTINHTVAGFIGMANRGPHTNGCQFYVTTIAIPWLNGKHTIFGKTVEGQRVIHIIEKSKTDTDDIPLDVFKVTDCGRIELNSPYSISDNPYDLWAWIKGSAAPLGMSFSILGCFQYILYRLNNVK